MKIYKDLTITMKDVKMKIYKDLTITMKDVLK